MESFAEFIKNYLKEQGLTYSSAAKICGIDRTILGRYANGSRRPQNKEMLSRLADGLQMSSTDRKEMQEAYVRTKVSEDYHTDYATIISVMNLRKQLDNKYASESTPLDLPKESVKSLHNEEDICHRLHWLVEGAVFIKLCFDINLIDENHELYGILHSAADECKGEQIITFKHDRWQDSQEKMETLRNIIPCAYNKKDWKVYYHYQHIRNSNESCVAGNFILTDKGIVFFDNKFTNGFFSNQTIPCNCYLSQFEHMRAKCRVFLESEAKLCSLSEDEAFLYDKSNIVFLGQKQEHCIYLQEKNQKTFLRLKEPEIIQLLWKFIWGEEEK